MNRVLATWGERLLGAFKYALAIFMIVAGIATMFSPLSPMGGDLGWLYASRTALILFGSFFTGSGFTLLYGKIRRRRKWVGAGLLSIYLCFFFAAVLNGIAWDWTPNAWTGNFVASLVVGLLYLRWRFKTEYIDPNHFVDDVDNLRPDGPPSKRK